MANEALIKAIVKNVGGKDNIRAITNCISRLRLSLNDYSLVDESKIEKLKGVIGISKTNDQFQIVLGDIVGEVCEEMQKTLGIGVSGRSAKRPPNQGAMGKRSIVGMFAETMSGIFAPMLPAFISFFFLMIFTIVLPATGLMNPEGNMAALLGTVSNVPMYFFPVLIAISSADRFGSNRYMAAAFALMLLHPNFTAMLGAGQTEMVLAGSFSLKLFSYSGTVIPSILIVYVQSKIEKLMKNYLPNFLKPVNRLFEVIIVAPIALFIIGPAGVMASDWIAQGYNFLYSHIPVIASGLFGGLYGWLVTTGTHLSLFPLMVDNMAKGGDAISMLTGVQNMALIGATIAVFIKTRNRSLKSSAPAAALTTLFGVTEPCLYGFCLLLKRPMLAAMAGGLCGGLIFGIFNITAVAPVGSSLILSFPLFIGGKMGGFLLGNGVAFLVSLVLTLILGWDDRENDEDSDDEAARVSETVVKIGKITKQAGSLYVLSPVEGKLVDIESVNDKIFATNVLGRGIAIIPEKGRVYAPFDGTVTSIIKTNHALGIKSVDGIELMIHIGLDTTELEGKYFTAHIKEGDAVSAGDLLLEFDTDAIRMAGFDLVTPVIIVNPHDYSEITLAANKKVVNGTPIISLKPETLLKDAMNTAKLATN